MPNSNTQTDVLSDGRIRFIITIGIGDPIAWSLKVSSNVNHNLGSSGNSNYPYFVETITGSNNITFYRQSNSVLYTSGRYLAELILRDNIADFDTFIIGDGGGSGTSSITLTSPNGNETWIRGTIQTIRWTATNNAAGGTVKIELLRSDNVVGTITESTPNTGSYSWGIPATTNPGSDYKVKVTKNGTSYYDISDNNFTISDNSGGCTNPQYKCVNNSCVSDYCDGTGTLPAGCNGQCGGTTQMYKCVDKNTNTCAPAPDGTFYTKSDCERSSTCKPCVPNWRCEQPLSGYEHDGCGSRRPSSNCETSKDCSGLTIGQSCIPTYMVIAGIFGIAMFIKMSKR